VYTKSTVARGRGNIGIIVTFYPHTLFPLLLKNVYTFIFKIPCVDHGKGSVGSVDSINQAEKSSHKIFPTSVVDRASAID